MLSEARGNTPLTSNLWFVTAKLIMENPVTLLLPNLGIGAKTEDPMLCPVVVMIASIINLVKHPRSIKVPVCSY